MVLFEEMEKIRAERIARRSCPHKLGHIDKGHIDKESKDQNKDKDSIGYEIERELIELKKEEPDADIFFRLAIIGYEFGYVQRALAYAHRFKENEAEREAYLADAKLEIADLLTQIHMLCIFKNWDFEGLRKLGVQHIKERFEDFKKNRWNDIK